MAENINPTPLSPCLKDTSSLYSETAEFPAYSGEDTADKLLSTVGLPMSPALHDSSKSIGESFVNHSGMDSFFVGKSPLGLRNTRSFRPTVNKKSNPVRYSACLQTSAEDNSDVISDVSVSHLSASRKDKKTRSTFGFIRPHKLQTKPNYDNVSLGEEKMEMDYSSTQPTPEDGKKPRRTTNFKSRKRKTQVNFQDVPYDDEDEETTLSVINLNLGKRFAARKTNKISVVKMNDASINSSCSESSLDASSQQKHHASPEKFKRKSQRRETEFALSDSVISSSSSQNSIQEKVSRSKRFKKDNLNTGKSSNKFDEVFNSESCLSDMTENKTITQSLVETDGHLAGMMNSADENKAVTDKEKNVSTFTAESSVPSPFKERSSFVSKRRSSRFPNQDKTSSFTSDSDHLAVENHQIIPQGVVSAEKLDRTTSLQVKKKLSKSASLTNLDISNIDPNNSLSNDHDSQATFQTGDVASTDMDRPRLTRQSQVFPSESTNSEKLSETRNGSYRNRSNVLSHSADETQSSNSTLKEGGSSRSGKLERSIGRGNSTDLNSTQNSSRSSKTLRSSEASRSNSRESTNQANRSADVSHSNMSTVEGGSFLENEDMEKSAAKMSRRNLSSTHSSSIENKSQSLIETSRSRSRQTAKQAGESVNVSDSNLLRVKQGEDVERSTVKVSPRNLSSTHSSSVANKSQSSAEVSRSSSRQSAKQTNHAENVSASHLLSAEQGEDVERSTAKMSRRNLNSTHSSVVNKSQSLAETSKSSSRQSAKQANQSTNLSDSNMPTVEGDSFFEGEIVEKSTVKMSRRNLSLSVANKSQSASEISRSSSRQSAKEGNHSANVSDSNLPSVGQGENVERSTAKMSRKNLNLAHSSEVNKSQSLAETSGSSSRESVKRTNRSANLSDSTMPTVEGGSFLEDENSANSTMKVSRSNLSQTRNSSVANKSQSLVETSESSSRDSAKRANRTANVWNSNKSTVEGGSLLEDENLANSTVRKTNKKNLSSTPDSSVSVRPQQSKELSESSSRLSKNQDQYSLISESKMSFVEEGSWLEGENLENSRTRASFRNLSSRNTSLEGNRSQQTALGSGSRVRNSGKQMNPSIDTLESKSSLAEQPSNLRHENADKQAVRTSPRNLNSMLNSSESNKSPKSSSSRSKQNDKSPNEHSASLKSKSIFKDQLGLSNTENLNEAPMTQQSHNEPNSRRHQNSNGLGFSSGRHENESGQKNQVPPQNVSSAKSHSDTFSEKTFSESITSMNNDKSSTDSAPGIEFENKIDFRKNTFNSENELVPKARSANDRDRSFSSTSIAAHSEIEGDNDDDDDDDDEGEESIFNNRSSVNNNDSYSNADGMSSVNGSLSSYSVSKICPKTSSDQTFVKDDESSKLVISSNSRLLSRGNEVDQRRRSSTNKCESDSGSVTLTPELSTVADFSLFASHQSGMSTSQLSGSNCSVLRTANESKMIEICRGDSPTVLDYEGNSKLSDKPELQTSAIEENMRLQISTCSLNSTNFERNINDESVRRKRSCSRSKSSIQNSKTQEENSQNDGNSSRRKIFEEGPESMNGSCRNGSLIEDEGEDEDAREDDAVFPNHSGQSSMCNNDDGEMLANTEASLNSELCSETKLSEKLELIENSKYFSSGDGSFNATPAQAQKSGVAGTVPATNIDEYFAKPLYPVNQRLRSLRQNRSSRDSTGSNRSVSLLSKCIQKGEKEGEKPNAPEGNQQPLHNMNLRKRGKDFPKYTTPKVSRPAFWVTNKLYSFLEEKLEPEYQINAKKTAEQFINYLQEKLKKLVNETDEESENKIISKVKHQMIEMRIINSDFMFFNFCFEFLPIELQDKIIPCAIPFSEKCSKSNFSSDTLFEKHF